MTSKLTEFFSDEEIARVMNGPGSLHRLPGSAFRSQAYHEFEQANWLDRTWLFVGRCSDIPNAGDVKPIPGYPMFLVRGTDSQVRVFHNACRHRGHRLVAEKGERRARLVCPYHKWTYGLDGHLLRAPHFIGPGKHESDAFSPEEHSLLQVRCGVWRDWIFINIDGGAEPLADFVAPLEAKLAFVDFGALKHFLTMTARELPANWKLCLENTMEPYHVPFIHAETAAGQPLAGHYMIVDDPVTGSAIDILGSEYTNRPGGSDLTTLNMSARFLCRLPNLFLTSYAPDVIVDTMILPDSRDPRKSWMEQAWYTTSGREMSDEEIERWRALEHTVIDEDIAVMRGSQEGVESSAVNDGGVLSPAWETCISGLYRHLVSRLSE